ncbi:MAG TPA: hypothetical protein VM925_27490, partial [Labilithrix sp.]|nr:hypothetical protein [Labilithrix sp.]
MPRFPTQPHYRWRIPMLEATRAGLAGDFVMADRLCAEALRIAKEGEIRVGKVVWALCRVSLAFLGGDPARIASDQQHLEAVALATRTRESRSFLALVYAATGRREEARATLGDAETWIDSYPFSIFCGEAIVLLGDTELASRLYPRLVSYATDHTFSWGPFGTVVFGPTPRIAA